MPATEADLAAAKLRLEGIPCFVADRNFGMAAVWTQRMVPLQVHQVDLERAREVLDRPAEPAAEGEYVDEDWRCPKCHRKKVELVPMSRGRKGMMLVAFALLLVPMLLGFLLNMLDLDTAAEALGPIKLPAILTAAALLIVIALSPRKKFCAACDHRW